MGIVRRIASIVAALAAGELACAAVTVHTDQASFDAATSTTVVVTFEESEWLPAFGANFYGSITSGGVVFVPISSPPITAPNLYVAPFGQTNFCCPLASSTLTSSGGEDIDLVFEAPPRAVGFTCYANGGDPIVWTLTLQGGATETIISPQAPSTVGFVGFTSDLPIEKLNWTSDFGDIINTGIDDVRVGTLVCAADLDGDGVVGASDLAILLGAWDGRGAADLDGSGAVDASDLAILLGAWGPCG